MDGEVETLEETVGRAVREYRKAAGITLDQLATAMREYGVNWYTARVIEFEKGRMRLVLPTLLAIVWSLSELLDRPMSLGDLIPDGPTWVRVTPKGLVARVLIREMMQGGTSTALDEGGPARSGEEKKPKVAAGDDILVATLAEERAARRIGVRPRQVAMWAHMLWGSHLDEEVARRAGADSTPQARGHVSRGLVDEIAAQIETYSRAEPVTASRTGGGQHGDD